MWAIENRLVGIGEEGCGAGESEAGVPSSRALNAIFGG